MIDENWRLLLPSHRLYLAKTMHLDILLRRTPSPRSMRAFAHSTLRINQGLLVLDRLVQGRARSAEIAAKGTISDCWIGHPLSLKVAGQGPHPSFSKLSIATVWDHSTEANAQVIMT